MAQATPRPGLSKTASGNIGGYNDSSVNIFAISVTANDSSGGGFILYDDEKVNPAKVILRVMVGLGRTSPQYRVGRLTSRGYVQLINSPLSVDYSLV